MLTHGERFAGAVLRSPDRVAVQQKLPQGYSRTTYRELHGRVTGAARFLIAESIRPQDRVAILSENRPEWVIAYLGTCLAGGVAVPLDPQISPGEWRRLLDDCGARAVFVSGMLLDALQEALDGSPLLDGIICLDKPGPGREGLRTLAGAESSGLGSPADSPLPASRPADPMVIIYTSGTTGNPKGVVLTQENIASEIDAALAAIPAVGPDDTFLCLLPLHHVFASVVSFLLPLSLGARVVFADTLKRSEIMAALEEAGITVLATVPQFFYLFHGRIREELARKGALAKWLFRSMLRFNRFCLRRLRLNPGRRLFSRIHSAFGNRMRIFVSGGSAFDPKVAQEFFDLGFTILQGYGLTETTGACAVTRVEDNVVGSVGPALPGVEIAILEPGADGIGEIAIRGPIVMKGYFRNEAETARAIRDGWFRSGDLGRLDGRGNLYITGRQKEVIVPPSGKNIYPDEIEAHYEQSAYIKELAVLGIAEPGHQGAERLHAVVVPDFDILKARKIANAREILRDEIARLSQALPQYKRLMSYQIDKEPLPRTTTRKIKRVELKRLIESGALREAESPAAARPAPAADRDLRESAVGQEVLSCLREKYRRDSSLDLDQNLELDLGFDSMERVELLASLEKTLGVSLPEGLGAEIFTVRDLIRRIQTQAGSGAQGSVSKLSWRDMLSADSLAKEQDLERNFSRTALALFEFAVLKLVHVLFRVLLRFECRGLENLPESGPFLICPNHQSFLDPLAILAPLPYRIVKRIFFVGATDFFAGAVMKQVARVANIISVDPDAHLLRAMKIGACGLRGGRILCIFPEGARSFDGRLGPFKKGTAILAREIGVPMVPAAIQGAHEAWARGTNRIRLHKVKVAFGTPITTGPAEGDPAYETDTDRLRQAVADMVEELGKDARP